METNNTWKMEYEISDGELWDDIMYDLFPNSSNEDEIADELDDLWND